MRTTRVLFAANPPRWLQPGDVVTIEIQHIAALTNPVVLESWPS